MPPERRTDTDDHGDNQRYDAVVPFQDLPVAPLEMAWSFGSADAQALLGEDQDFDRLRKAYLWWDAEAARERGNPILADFKLPFAKLIDGTLTAVWNGLTAAVGAVGGARQKPDIPADQLRGAFNHAIRYYRKINKGLPDDEQKAIPEFKGDDARDDGGLKREYREDRVPFLRPSMRMDDGRLMVQAFIAKPGVLTYRLADGREVKELIPASELHDPASLLTLGQVPVTLEHPRVDVDPDNVGELAIGNIGDKVTIADNGFVQVNMVIRRADGISAVQSRDKGETSPGYTTLIDPTPGVDSEFGRYDAIQRGRRYNHVAVTEAARGGHDIKLRADSGVQVLPPSNVPDPPPVPEATMHLRLMPLLLSSLALMGIGHTDAEDVINPLGNLTVDRADAASVSAADTLIMDTLRTAFDKMTGAYQALKGENDALSTAAAAAKAAKDQETDEDKHDSFMAMHADRLGLEVLAKTHGLDPASDEVRKLDNAKLRMAVVKKLNPDVRTDADDSYARAYIDAHAKHTRKDAWAGLSDTDDPKVPREDDDTVVDPSKKPATSPSQAHRRSLDSAFNDAKPTRA